MGEGKLVKSAGENGRFQREQSISPHSPSRWRSVILSEDEMIAIKTRHVLSTMCFLGVTIVNLMRVNLSLAIVEMAGSNQARNNNRSNSEECYYHVKMEEDRNITKTKEFYWNSVDQGIILGSFYYGYLVGNLFAGRLSENFGGVRVFGLGVLITSILTLFTPLAARSSRNALIALRILEGLSESMVFPALQTISSKWIPTKELGFTYALMCMGIEFATVLGFPIAGALSSSHFLGGWPACFYVFGCAGFIWYVFWWFLIFESPNAHPRIFHEEKIFILEHIQHKVREKAKVPWLKLLTSVPLWASILSCFLGNWSVIFGLTDLPTFLARKLHINIETNGLLSSIPLIANMFSKCASGLISDLAVKRNFISVTTTRKAVHLLFSSFSAVAFLAISWTKCDRVAAMACLVVAVGFHGSMFTIGSLALLDMAPDYAGTTMGLLCAFTSVPGFIVPWTVAILTGNENAMNQWHKCFYLIGGITFAGGLLYAIFGSSELQPWAKTGLVQNEETVLASTTTCADFGGTQNRNVELNSKNDNNSGRTS